MAEGDQKVQTSTYEIIKSWGCDIQHMTIVDNTIVYLKVAKRINHKVFIIRKTFVW